MTRATFGATAGDFVSSVGPGHTLRVGPATLTLWSAATGGTQHTDLLLNGSPVTSIPVGRDGQVPAFQGPDGVSDVWADAGGGSRVRLVPDLAGALQAAASQQTAGKNLYDKAADYGPDTFWNGASGTTPVALAGWYASAKITGTPLTTYVVNTPRQIITFGGAGNNTAKRYINNASEAAYSFTLAADETAFAFNVAAAKRDLAQAEVGSTPTSYEPYGVKVPRLLANGDYMETYAADTRSTATAARKAAGVTVYRNGNDLLVRGAFDSSSDVLMPFSLASVLSAGSETMVQFFNSTYANVTKIPNTATDSQVFPLLASAVTGTAIHNPADDICPINVQWSYIGANHGYVGATTVTMTGHGKTNADRGSTWTDGTRTYTLLQVIDANKVLMGHQYSVASGVVTGSTTVPAADLTHVSGATNTATLTVAGGKVLTEIHPCTHSHAYTVTLDGRPLADGTAAGDLLTITESYDIVSFKALIDWSRANIGADPFANLASMGGLARIYNTYRVTRGQVVVAQRPVALEKMTVNVGITQAIPLTVPAGGSKKEFIPGVGTVGGLNFATLADLSTMTADIDIAPANYSHALYPPQRMVQWAYDSAAAPAWGLEVGLLPVADGHPSQRVKNAATKSWFISNSFKKNYPQIAWAKTLNIGESLSGTAYRTYLAPPDTTAEVIVSDGSDTFVFLDRPSGTTTSGHMDAPGLLGRRLVPVEKLRVSGVPDRVRGDGISYTVAAAPGSGAWKAIDEKATAPALLGGHKTVGNYFTFPGVKATLALTGSYQILYLFPMTLPEDTPVDRVLLDVSAVGTGVVRHGVYAHDPQTGQPVTAGPLADFGTLDVTGTGIKGDVDLAATVWLPTTFWYGIVWQTTNTTAPTLRVFSAPVASLGTPIDLGATAPVSSAASRLGYSMSGVSGALGALSGIAPHGFSVPAVIFRRAAA